MPGRTLGEGADSLGPRDSAAMGLRSTRQTHRHTHAQQELCGLESCAIGMRAAGYSKNCHVVVVGHPSKIYVRNWQNHLLAKPPNG